MSFALPFSAPLSRHFSDDAAPVSDTTANCKSKRAAALQAGERHGRVLRSGLPKSRIFQFTFPQVRGGRAGQIPQARNGLAAKSAGLLYSDVRAEFKCPISFSLSPSWKGSIVQEQRQTEVCRTFSNFREAAFRQLSYSPFQNRREKLKL